MLASGQAAGWQGSPVMGRQTSRQVGRQPGNKAANKAGRHVGGGIAQS